MNCKTCGDKLKLGEDCSCAYRRRKLMEPELIKHEVAEFEIAEFVVMRREEGEWQQLSNGFDRLADARQFMERWQKLPSGQYLKIHAVLKG